MSQAPRTPPSCAAALATTLALIDHFAASIVSSSTENRNNATNDAPTPPTPPPSPLLLLATAARSLKSQVAKLSLLTVTPPFTRSAIVTALQPINDSILPSLVTASILVSAHLFTPAFAKECRAVVQDTLRELKVLVGLVALVEASAGGGSKASTSKSKGKDKNKDKKATTPQDSTPPATATATAIIVTEEKKKEITDATARVWQDCDVVVAFADGGLPGFVASKARQWLDLMKDAVAELQDWDPDEEVDEDDLFGDVGSEDGDNDGNDDGKREGLSEEEEEKARDRATISAGVKEQALKVLARIPQSVHVVVKQRLEKLGGQQQQQQQQVVLLPSDLRARLDPALATLRCISELIDQSAEALYLANPELCLKKAGEARALTIEFVENAVHSFGGSSSSKSKAGSGPGSNSNSDSDSDLTQEDKYVRRALDWIRQVETPKRVDDKKVK